MAPSVVASVVAGIDGGDVSNERAARLGVVLATSWLVALTIANLALPENSIPDPLYPVAVLIVCAVCSVRTTAIFAAITVLLTVFSGIYNHVWDSGQQWVRFTAVVLIGGAAVVVAAVRVSREHRFERVAAIAEVAQRVILPTMPRAAGTVHATAHYWSSAEDAMVGGDLYDCSLAGGRVRFLIGDMRGKGIGAIEQAARVIRAFRQSAALHADLDKVAEDVRLAARATDTQLRCGQGCCAVSQTGVRAAVEHEPVVRRVIPELEAGLGAGAA